MKATDWPWWHASNDLWRHTRDLVTASLQTLRPSLNAHAQAQALREAHSGRALHLVHDLGVTSLELLSLGATLCEATGMRQPEHLERLHTANLLDDWVELAQLAWQASAESPQPVVRFRTSGSTGRPKACVHPWPWLQQEAQALAQHLSRDGAPRRVVSVVRCHHIYGHLFTLLLPRALGGAGMPVLDGVMLPPAAVLAQLQPGDLVVGYPDWWRIALQCGLPLPPGVIGVTSTAPCPPDTAAAALDAGLSRLVHIYGSTETAGIAWKEALDDAFTLMPHWQRPPDELDGSHLIRLTPDGERVTVALPDQVRWLDDTHLAPTGRVDQAVQVGGVNVRPQDVRQHFLAHPEVADASVRLHDFDGVPRLKLFVVPRHPDTDACVLLASLQDHGLRLAPPARPAHIALGQRLPVSAMGKACDWPVPAPQG